jgi:hypothetical protein
MRWIEKIAHGYEYRPHLKAQRAVMVVCSHIPVNSIRKGGEKSQDLSCSGCKLKLEKVRFSLLNT